MTYSVGRAEGEISIKYDGKGVNEAEKDLDKFNKKSQDDSKKTGKITKQTQEAATAAGKGFLVAGGTIAAGMAVAVKAAVGFEQRMSGVKAVSGASGAEMQKLTDLALKLGAATKYNAEEAGQAIEELIKAGVSVPDVMNGAAKATVNLAAAGEIDLPKAAEIASNAMNTFSIAGSKMPKIADLIAGAANASAIDVKEFGYSVSQAGAVANLVGLSFDDLSVAIAEMGNAGIKGSDAGTSIKTFLSNLIPTTDKQRALFVELGLVAVDTGENLKKLAAQGIKPVSNSYGDVVDALEKYVVQQGLAKEGSAKAMKLAQEYGNEMGVLQNQFFDSEGKIKSFAEVQDLLQKSTAGLTKEQKLSALETMFGSDAIRAAAVFADNGAKGYNDMASAMSKVTAEGTAQERMNNLAGQWEELTGALETLAIDVGRILLPFLKDLVGFIQLLVDQWQKLSPATKKVMVIITALVGIFLILMGAVLVLIAPFMAMAALATAAGAALLPIIGIVAAIIVGLMLLVAAVILVVKNWQKIKDFAIKIWTSIKNFFIGLWDSIRSIFDAAVTGIADFFKNAWGGIVSFFTNIWAGIAEFFSGLWKSITDIVAGAWQAISDAVSRGIEFIKNLLTTALNILLAPWRAFWNLFGGLFTAIWDLMKAVAELAIKAIVFVVMSQAMALRALWEKVWGGVSGFFIDVWNQITGFIGPKVDWVRNKVVSGFTWMRDRAIAILTKVRDFLVGLWARIVEIHVNAFNRIVSGVTGFLSRIWNPIQSRLTSIKNKFSEIWNAVLTNVRSVWDRVVTYVSGQITKLLAKITGIKDRVVNVFKSAGTWLLSAGKRIIQGLIDGLTAKIKYVTDLLRDLTDKIPDWKGPESTDKKLLKDNGGFIIKGLIDAIAAGVPDLESMLSQLTTDIPGMMGVSTVTTNTSTSNVSTIHNGAKVYQQVTNNYPVAERGSKAANRDLQLAGAFGEAA